mmetsp:Transcript_5128/g.10731  ORF Transcript_5128/g.10731 Transcript_5128/m.10731 type:complete len:1082 (-) Transcript_5128:667-3912(-)
MSKQVISTNNSTTAQKAKSTAAKLKISTRSTAATPSASASAYKRSTTTAAKPLFRFTVTQSKCTHCGTIKPAASKGTHSGKWRVRIIGGDEVSAGECRGCNKRGWDKTGAKSFYVEGAKRGEYGEAKAKIAEYLRVGREMVVLAGSPDLASSAVGVAVASNRNEGEDLSAGVDNAMWNGHTGVCSSYHPSQWHKNYNHRPMAYANTGDNCSQQLRSTFEMSIANILFSDHNNFTTESTALKNPSFANTASSSMSTSSSAKTLTEEQRKRMETNRQRALQTKRRSAEKVMSPIDQSLQSFGDNSAASNLPRRSPSIASHRSAPRYNPTNYDSALSQPLSQDSTITTSSSDANNPTTPKHYRKPSFNPYTSRRSVSNTTVIPDTKTQSSSMSGEQAEASIPPLPEDAPPLRELTVQMLSEQQLEVVKLARPPTASGDDLCTGSSTNDEGNEHDNNTYDNPPKQPQGYIVRLTACAGAGKTTNLLHLALRCKDLGHKNLTYVTFSKASAKDAEERIMALMTEEKNQTSTVNDAVITASTLHSCAMRALMGNDDHDEDQDTRLLSDEALVKLFREEFDDEIGRYLAPAIRHIHDTVEPKKRKARERTLREQVLFYLKKTFRYFCTSKMSLETFREEEDNPLWSWSPRHYFPVTKDFQLNGKAEKLGFPSSIYSSRKSYRFYADLCAQFWDLVDERGVRTFDIMMKKAQLKGIRIPCTVLLVDECQDLDACQVDLIAKQKDYGAQIFFVGDAAQTIYSFRGAKSSNVMSLPGCVDRLLTKSWRFGPAIARVANIALFVKEHCPQTTNYEGKTKKQWNPYRVEGSRGEDESEVVAKSLMTDWKKNKPIALIGRTNGSLIIEALALMGLSSLQQQGCDDDTVGDNSSYNDEELETDSFDVDSILRDTEIPKFHINGRGESSGIKRWRTSMSQIEHLYDLYMAKEGGGSLPRDMFPEFSEASHITWDSFLEAFVARELTKYSQAVQLIISYKKNTIKAIHVFQAKVMSQMYSMDEADIILTTCHASKGLEFDNVELCNDFLNVSKASYSCYVREDHRHPAFLCPTTAEYPGSKKRRFGWQFNLNSYGAT